MLAGAIGGIFYARRHIDLARIAVARAQPHLPFTIESLEFDWNWKDLRSFTLWRLPSLRTVLRWQDWRIRAAGPLELERGETSFTTRWQLRATYESATARAPKPPAPVDLDLVVRTDREFKRLLGFEAKASAQSAEWSEGNSAVQISGLSARVSGESFEAMAFELGVRGAEVLLGDFYADLALSELPIRGKISLKPGLRVSADISHRDGEADATLAQDGRAHVIDWRIQKLSAVRLLPFAANLAKIPWLNAWRVKSGALSSSGRVRITDGSAKLLAANAGLKSFSFEWPESQIAAGGITADISLADRGVRGSVAAQRLLFRRIEASLESTRFAFKRRESKYPGWTVEIGEGSRIPLAVNGFDLKIAPFRGTRGADPDDAVLTSLKAEPFALEKLMRGLCVGGDRIPPVAIRANLSKIEIGDDWIDPTGTVSADLFGGWARADEIGFYDLKSGVPEFDFTLDFDGIKLSELGEWTALGEMDGVLVGYARDVTFQSWLPTLFDFRFEAKPDRKRKIVFSPDAMKGVVRLFAGEDIEHLPGIANWLAFGWPSRVFGGYDVHYFGVAVKSKDGIIELRTLDPPLSGGATRNDHFILYGPRFRMPLNSSRYPVMADAPAMSNYVHQMVRQLQKLADEKKGLKGISNENRKLEDCVPRL